MNRVDRVGRWCLQEAITENKKSRRKLSLAYESWINEITCFVLWDKVSNQFSSLIGFIVLVWFFFPVEETGCQTLLSSLSCLVYFKNIATPLFFGGEVVGMPNITLWGWAMWWEDREHKVTSERVRAGSSTGPVSQGPSAYSYPTLKDILEDWCRGEKPVLGTWQNLLR